MTVGKIEANKLRIYQQLAAVYGYLPNQIADMTPDQQSGLCDSDTRLLNFATQSEYQQWLTKQK